MESTEQTEPSSMDELLDYVANKLKQFKKAYTQAENKRNHSETVDVLSQVQSLLRATEFAIERSITQHQIFEILEEFYADDDDEEDENIIN